MRRMTVLATTVLLALAAAALPAQAAIHEIVASHCSGGNGNLEPPGLSGPGPASVRPLLATGIYEQVKVNDGTPTTVVPSPFPVPSPDPGDTIRTLVWFVGGEGLHAPASKFDWDGMSYWEIPIPVAPGVWDLLYVPAVTPDHPAFEHCPNMH